MSSAQWYFIKGLLDARTAAKVCIVGSKYKKELEGIVPPESIPECLGGGYKGYNEPFAFDVSEGGLLAYPHRQYPFVADDGEMKVSADDVRASVPVAEAEA